MATTLVSLLLASDRQSAKTLPLLLHHLEPGRAFLGMLVFEAAWWLFALGICWWWVERSYELAVLILTKFACNLQDFRWPPLIGREEHLHSLRAASRGIGEWHFADSATLIQFLVKHWTVSL